MSAQSLPPSLHAAIARLHAAMGKVANGDVSHIKALYAHSDDASSFYGWGGYEKGWDAVSKRWDWAGAQFKGGTVSYQNVTTVATGQLAYTTDIETFQVRMDGMDQPTQWSNRSRTFSGSRTIGAWCTGTPIVWRRGTSQPHGCSGTNAESARLAVAAQWAGPILSAHAVCPCRLPILYDVVAVGLARGNCSCPRHGANAGREPQNLVQVLRMISAAKSKVTWQGPSGQALAR